ncbi:MAG: hypothetical protein ACD_75C02086G0002 [uncultured bacterium]|nr:MAG: hypothetical protein ACD_75C02086G0002 [uncultured bacterium]
MSFLVTTETLPGAEDTSFSLLVAVTTTGSRQTASSSFVSPAMPESGVTKPMTHPASNNFLFPLNTFIQ